MEGFLYVLLAVSNLLHISHFPFLSFFSSFLFSFFCEFNYCLVFGERSVCLFCVLFIYAGEIIARESKVAKILFTQKFYSKLRKQV